MHPDIKKLLAVQEVDKRLARLNRDAASLPAEEARRRARLEQFRAQHEKARSDLESAEVESRAAEKSIMAADQELKKLQGRLNTVKNNAEYQATLFQIESVKRERGEVEEEGLAILEKLEGLREAAAAAARKLEEEEATFTEFCREAEVMQKQVEADRDKVAVEREAIVADVPRDLLDKYSSIFGVRESMAVCPVEGEVCTGCYTRVTPNDMARLLGEASIVQCGSCQRILYLPEA